MTYNNFSRLNIDAKIFEALELNPQWWTLLKEDEDLHIDVRKDKSVYVYYKNNAIIQINFTSDFKASIHKKYVDGRFFNKSPYTDLDLASLTPTKLTEIKARIDAMASETKEATVSEKQLINDLFLENPIYIDADYQYSKDPEMGKMKLNLIELTEDTLSIVEVKNITNEALDNTTEASEILVRMSKLSAFIRKYDEEITMHYNNLIAIKQRIGLLSQEEIDFTLNMKPKLLIINTYARNTKVRKERTEAIKTFLTENNIDAEVR